MKKALALLLCVIMLVGSLTACGSKDKNANDNKDTNSGATATEAPKPTEANESTPTPEPEDELEPVTLKVYFHGSSVKDDKAVLEKVNEYLKEKINVTLEPIWGTWADYDDNASLALNTGEDIDIYFTASWGTVEYNSFAKKGAFVRLDAEDNDLLGTYGKDVWNILPDVLKSGATIIGSDGLGVYAIPAYKDIATQNTWDVNVTMLKKYGFTVEDVQKAGYYGFGDILAKIKAGEEAERGETFYPFIIEGAVLERMVTNSIIITGDAGSLNVMSYYIDPADPSKPSPSGEVIYNKYATPEYKKFVEKTREYFLAGYIDPGFGLASQANDLLTKKRDEADYALGTQVYSFGYEAQASQQRGIEVAYVPCTPPYADTTSSQGAMFAVSTASKNPDRAVMFLNLLNTDPYLFTLLDYGIEGVHYNLENGEVVFTENRSDYSPWTNGMGNVTQLPPIKGQGLDFQDRFKAYYGAAYEIPVLGFAFDAKPVENELLAVANAGAEYALGLDTGTIDPAENLPLLLKTLEDNGIKNVIDEANAQLKAFLDAKVK